MLTLVTFPGTCGEPSGSSFGCKAMCLLKLSGLEWQIDYQNDPRKSPKAKFPLLKDGTSIIPDTEDIRHFLEERSGKDFDAGLSPEKRAVSRAIIRMVDEHLYFILYADRWMNDAVWAEMKDRIFGHVPAIMRGLLSGFVRKGAITQIKGQGVGRHSEIERTERAQLDLQALTTLLGDKPFLFGDHPTAADCSTVPMINGILKSPVPTPLSQMAAANDALVQYAQRGREALYPDAQ